MLVLGREVGESILINDGEIEVKIVSCNRGQVKLAIQAPRSINIARKEIYKNKEERLNHSRNGESY
ncbi:MAG: carbon storage regulator [Pseudomonadota bacterium]